MFATHRNGDVGSSDVVAPFARVARQTEAA
jgi:hypothetical protein